MIKAVGRPSRMACFLHCLWAMPSAGHEALVDLFRCEETFGPQVLTRLFGLELPDYERAELTDGGFTEAVPTELRADLVVLLRRGEVPVHGIVIEVQMSEDSDKRFSWPAYAMQLRNRYRCSVSLLVVTMDRATAAWASEPFDIGHGVMWAPLVLGADLVPHMTVEEVRAAPALGVLCAIAHSMQEHGLEQILAVFSGLSEIDDELRPVYYDLIMAGLPKAAQEELEAMALGNNYEYKSDAAKKLIAQGQAVGKAEGQAEMFLEALQHRGFIADASVRARVEGATSETLKQWMLRLMDGADLDQLFRDA